MTHKNNKIKRQLFIYASGLLLISFLTACSDSKESQAKTEESSKVAEVVNSAKIEVVQNNDVHAVKVAEKKKNTTKNDSFYYDYGKKKAKPRTEMDAQMNIRNSYQKIQISMVVGKLSKDFIVKCSACHADYAEGIVGPSLLDKNATYIYQKINEFKKDKKKNVLMYELVKMMSDKEIKKISHEIYNFNVKIKEIRNK